MGIEWPHETIKQGSPSFTPPKNDLERFIGSLIQNMPRGFQLGKSDVSLGICNVSALNTDPVFKRLLMSSILAAFFLQSPEEKAH